MEKKFRLISCEVFHNLGMAYEKQGNLKESL